MVVKRGVRGQVTIFIIIAILIIALGVLVYMFYPQIRSTIETETTNPATFIQECIEEKIQNTVDIISLQGGSVEPGYYYAYYNGKNVDNVEYLCYTNEYYMPCVVQQPLLAQHIQSEILNEIREDSIACFNSMQQSYENQGYDVNMKSGNMTVELLPKRIVTTYNYELTLTKGDTQNYKNFQVVLNDNLYELTSIANSIINWETIYGEAEITTYMNYYHDLKVEQKKQIDETSIYILTDRNNNKKFQFAVRSFAFPPGISP